MGIADAMAEQWGRAEDYPLQMSFSCDLLEWHPRVQPGLCPLPAIELRK